MGMFRTRLDNVVLLFKKCPFTRRTLLFSNSNNGFLPHHTSRTRDLNVMFFFHRYPSLTLDDVTRLEGILLGTLCNLVSSLRCLLVLSRRRLFGETFLLHLIRPFALRKGFDGLRHRRCIRRGGEYRSSRYDGRMNSTRVV